MAYLYIYTCWLQTNARYAYMKRPKLKLLFLLAFYTPGRRAPHQLTPHHSEWGWNSDTSISNTASVFFCEGTLNSTSRFSCLCNFSASRSSFFRKSSHLANNSLSMKYPWTFRLQMNSITATIIEQTVKWAKFNERKKKQSHQTIKLKHSVGSENAIFLIDKCSLYGYHFVKEHWR